ncbi:GGDEF-domain containing protein [Paractinoplanes abujensis]|uniref:Diguanylate cyclase (GGDEF)-like protein n=1 Tax=Paractinoplanes abujensis TaxID=882441 RepID=A0A7W7G588_9ACTN|nr:EAL domain-containing protein [Actinoplanes abujensis]MBB4698168.1 diguanylate cyclase (GGDEF)-like protein [Actinoplanes abujensis]GID19346.1 GGDEF-domain containing protein [Actinoplanes abujensis]
MLARLLVTLAIVLGVTALGEFAGPPGWRISADAAQLVIGAAAALICFAAARSRTGLQRRWRIIVGAGLTGWALNRLWWVVQDVVVPDRTLTMVSDIGFFLLPMALLGALLVAPYTRPRSVPASPRRDQFALMIDSVLIAGSLLALAYSTVPRDWYRWDGQPTSLIVAAAVYPVADLMLATMVGLLLLTRPGSPTVRKPLTLAGAAIVAFGVTDTLRFLHLADGPLPPWQMAGHLLGPALLAVAALSSPAPVAAPPVDNGEREWLHLVLPYVPVTATGVMIAINGGAGKPLTPFEAYLGWLGLGLVVARQMFTIVDNTVLLDRVSEGQKRLHHQAYHDPLTGLANRALFTERLTAALGTRPVAVLFADLDDFKLINDSFGHGMGDRVLRAIAERLQRCVSSDDLVARLGGDEFAVLLDHHAADAEPAGHRILKALREPFTIDGHTMGVGASLGLVVTEPGEPMTADALLRRADSAMYSSKRRGKGSMARYAGTPDGGPNADLPHLLAEALASGHPAAAGFEVFYQPIVRFSDGATVAVEALARWTSPVAGPVHPDVFVSVAERTGLVAAIDDFVLDQACVDAATLAHVCGRPIDIHVNVSAARLGQTGLEESVAGALARSGLPPSRLVLEITETRRIQDITVAAAMVERLRSHGVRIALDDFGSGYNALAQLHSLPVDIVKLDATLTDLDIAPGRAEALCRSVLAICTDLSIVVVAEGIETPARAHALAAIGCPLGQGYLFGQPGPLHRWQAIPAVPPSSAAHLAS